MGCKYLQRKYAKLYFESLLRFKKKQVTILVIYNAIYGYGTFGLKWQLVFSGCLGQATLFHPRLNRIYGSNICTDIGLHHLIELLLKM